MFRISQFNKYRQVQPTIRRLNIAFEKKYSRRIRKLVKDLLKIYHNGDNDLPITYAFSVIAEHDFKFLPAEMVDIAFKFASSHPRKKVRINATGILGQFLIHSSSNDPKFQKILNKFLSLLTDPIIDIRDNVVISLSKLQEKLDFFPYFEILLTQCKVESASRNIISILELLLSIEQDLELDQLLDLRSVIIALLERVYPNKKHLFF